MIDISFCSTILSGVSSKYVTERDQLSDLAAQLNQVMITSNPQMSYADVHDRKEAVKVRKSLGAFNQLQQQVEIQVDKERDDGYTEALSAEARRFVTF